MPSHKPVKAPATLKATLKNRLLEINGFNQHYWEFARQYHVEHAVSQTLILAFDELLSNIINYAYEDNSEHEIEILIELTEDTVTAHIVDDGIPFNPLQREEPDTTLSLEAREIGGLGIHLVRQIVDTVNYERLDGKNIVTLIQHR
jgi:anti-sigma regulatory factor (Ser/Thr protein kinase)